MSNFFISVLILLGSAELYAAADKLCGDQQLAPYCPTTGSTLLDETYPTSSFVISIDPAIPNSQSMKVPGEFVLKVLKSYNFNKNGPKIFIPTSQKDYDTMIDQLKKEIKASKGSIPPSVLDQIVYVPMEKYTWQQDYFESFVDLKTGKPILRDINSYGRPVRLGALADKMGSCGASKGEPLKDFFGDGVNQRKSWGNGEMGGNIEGLPGGSCMVGNNQSLDFAAQFCGSKENIVQLNVDWLEVGHVDELFKVVSTKREGIPNECNFTILTASPDKAIELLKANPGRSSNPFLSVENHSKQFTDKDSFKKSRSTGKAGIRLCSIYNKGILPGRTIEKEKEKQKNGNAKRVEILFKFLMIEQANAGMKVVNSGKQGLECSENVDNITNREMLDAITNDSYLLQYNQKIQESINQSKEKIKEQILKRLPQCRSSFEFLDVPNIFSGTMKENSDGTMSLPNSGNGGAINPNPTNSVMANDTLIYPDPQNELFRDYLAKEIKTRGMKTDFVDTWDYSHQGDGNLHCSTHSVLYCRPKK